MDFSIKPCYYILVFYLTSLADGQIPDGCVPGTATRNPPPRCGSVIDGDHNGTIFHKPYEIVDSNERCVWILETGEKNNTFDFEILYLGYNGNQTNGNHPRLLLAYNLFQESPNEVVLNTTGNIQIVTVGHVVLTFSTGVLDDSNFKGFVLMFNRTDAGGREPSIISLPATYVDHSGPTYTTRKSLIVIPPDNNYFPGGGYSLAMLQKQEYLSVHHYADVYHYNSTSTTKNWQWTNILSDASPTAYIEGHQDIVMVVIQPGFASATFFNILCHK